MLVSNDIGIDLGTASILVYIKGKGVVLKEPSVVAIDRDSNKIMAIGEEARLMIGRTPGNIIAVRPLRQGGILIGEAHAPGFVLRSQERFLQLFDRVKKAMVRGSEVVVVIE